MEHVGARLIDCADDGLADPVLGTPLKPALDPWQWEIGQGRPSSVWLVRPARRSTRIGAAQAGRDIPGTNDRGKSLPLPDGCDAAGFPIGAVTAVGAAGQQSAAWLRHALSRLEARR